MISIIVPVYNGEKAIGECLAALLDQDFAGEREIIVVDDGSTDSTAEKVGAGEGVLLLQQPHKGPAAARNEGIRKARGEIILFTDADCVPERSWVTEMVRLFQDRAVAGVQGAYKTKQSSLMARFCQLEIEDRYRRMKKKGGIDFIGTYSAAYRKEVLGDGFDESFTTASGEDAELSYRLARSHALVFNPEAVVYHQHPASLRKYLATKFFRAHWRVPLYKKHRGKMAQDSYTPHTLKLQIGVLYLLVISLLLSGGGATSLFIPGMLYAIFVLLSVPFFLFALRQDRRVAVASLVLLQLRAAAFSLGLVHGMVRRGA